ncbi:hypothetical protein [Nocardioides perillae]|uniref:Lipoprotein n=1 Tax=Nocardioides perillae TaxID=1119534 RepID=A0A7Y9ULJ4_9ACTN|nr:hypothetical protein [Nocardioides perillae]NYG55137.1 hypothetical protein [Nocardioides perillae]
MTRLHPGRLLAALVVPLLLAGCGVEDGAAAALEDDSFAACLDAAGVGVDDSGDRDVEEQLTFWAEPGTLECATTDLEGEARREALAGAFAADAEGVDDLRQRQWQVLGDWAARTADDAGVEVALEQAEVLLSGIEVADDGDGQARLRGYAGAVVSSALRATGGLTSYDAHLATEPTVPDTVDGQVAFLAEGPGSGPGRPDEEEWRRFEALRDDLVAAVS